MKRLGTEGWAGIAMLAVSIGVASPTLFGMTEPIIPRGWWTVLFAVFVVSILAATAALDSQPVRRGSLALAIASSWALVLTAQSTGLLLVLLVVTAAASVYLIPLWASFVVVALNTGVIALLSTQASPGIGNLILIGFYLLIQAASVLSSATLTREQRMRGELAEAHVELRSASILLSESSRNAERLRISRDLHDLIGHQLTVLTLELETARHMPDEIARTHLDRADRVARELLRDVRATVGRLRSEAPDLERALHEMTAALPGLAVTVDVSPDVRVDEEHSEALIRAAQEIITNTLRHADARELRIEVRSEQEGVILHAVDDGRGARKFVLGNGLRGLQERFAGFGGEVTVDGRDGFAVTARMPVP